MKLDWKVVWIGAAIVTIVIVLLIFEFPTRGRSESAPARAFAAGEGEPADGAGMGMEEPPDGSRPEEEAEREQEHEVEHLVPVSPPDTPPEPIAIRPEFGEALLNAAKVNGSGNEDEACIEWGRLLMLAMEDDAGHDERDVALMNIADACSRTHTKQKRSAHELRMAHEAYARAADENPQNKPSLDKFEANHPELEDTRSDFFVANQHAVGTEVSLDGIALCTEPCTIAVPIDGKPHRIQFAGLDGETPIESINWSPSMGAK